MKRGDDQSRKPLLPLVIRFLLSGLCLVAGISLLTGGCGVINPGKPLWIVWTDPDENYYLVKDATLTAGSVALARDKFDHTMQSMVKLVFTPRQARNYYVSKTVWYDPNGEEFRTLRQTHSRKAEADKGITHPKGPVTRVHVMPLYDLWRHKPGRWKVELYIDNKLARRLTFTVR